MRIRKPASEGYVFYDNLGTIGNDPSFWASIKTEAHNYFSKVELQDMPGLETASKLESWADAERTKEKKLLREFFGTDIDNETLTDGQLVQMMNEALNIKDVFERVVNRLLNEKSNPSELASRSTNIASIYGSYLQTEVKKELTREMNNKRFVEAVENKDDAKLLELWNYSINRAMDTALTRTLSAPSVRNSDEHPWIEALNAINQMKDFRNKFKKRFYSMYGFDKMETSVWAQWKKDTAQKISRKEVGQMLKTDFKSLMNNLPSQQIAGYVAENLATSFVGASTNRKGITFKGSTTDKSGFSTDVVHLIGQFDSDIEIDFSQMLASDKTQAADSIKTFYQKLVDSQSKGTVVYESTKKYNLGETFKGFKGTSFNIQSLEEMLSRINYPHASAMLNKLKQTIPGTIYEGEAAAYQSELSKNLATYIAYFLFDDWETIGNEIGDVNVVHVFRLSDIVVPLSYVLSKMAQAMRDAINNLTSYVRVNFTLPGNILYPESFYPTTDTEGSEVRWEAQKEAANDITITIEFLANFKKLMTNDLSGLFSK